MTFSSLCPTPFQEAKGLKMRGSYFNPSLFNAFRLPVAAFVPLWLLTGAASFASAQNARNAAASETREWAQGAIDHAQQMRIHKDSDQGSQPTPPIIKKLDIDDNPGGQSQGAFATEYTRM